MCYGVTEDNLRNAHHWRVDLARVPSALNALGHTMQVCSCDLNARTLHAFTCPPVFYCRLTPGPLRRLRKAVLHAIANSRANEHDMAARLNESMMAKVRRGIRGGGVCDWRTLHHQFHPTGTSKDRVATPTGM